MKQDIVSFMKISILKWIFILSVKNTQFLKLNLMI